MTDICVSSAPVKATDGSGSDDDFTRIATIFNNCDVSTVDVTAQDPAR
jgi:hypothetical protein